jgi:hypothetical protein
MKIRGFNNKVRAYRNAYQTITTDTWTKVELNAENYDGEGEFDPAVNYRFTATKAGYYLVSGIIKYENAAFGLPFYIAFYKGGLLYSQMKHNTVVSSGDESVNLTDIIPLNAGEYIELWTYHYMGGPTKKIMPGTDITFMTIHRIS